MTDPGALSPREEAIVMLASGDLPATVAAVLETNATAVKAVGRAYGYPQSRSQIKAVADRLTHGDREDLKHADALPGCPWVHPSTPAESPEDDVPSTTAEPEVLEHLEERAAAREADDRTALIEETAEILQILDRAMAPSDRATLTMPLGRLIDADGRETVLGVVEIDVQLHVPGVLEALAGQLFMGAEGGHLVVPTRIERRLTPEGAAAIRQLAALLEETPGGEVR